MVVSKINNEINYDEKKQLHKNDIGKSTSTYLIELEDLNTKAIVGVGTEVNKYIEKSIIYFPLYLVLNGKKKDSDESNFEKIGVYEIPSNELMNVLDDEGELDLEKLEEVSDKLENELGFQIVDPLLFSYITKKYITENNQSLESFMNEDQVEDEDDEGDEPESSDDEEDVKEEEEIDYDDENNQGDEDDEGEEPESDDELDLDELPEDSGEEDEDEEEGDDGEEDDDEDDEEDEEDDENDYETDDIDSDESSTEESSSEELEDEELEKFEYIFDNWLTQLTRDTNFNIIDNEGGGDCFFAVVRDAYKSIDKIFSVKALRELLSREATMEVFQTYKELYRSYKASIKESNAQMKRLKKKNLQLQKQIESGMNDLLDKKQVKLTKKERSQIVKEAKENKKKFERLAKERANSEVLMAEYSFMKGVKSLCDFKKIIKQSDFWAETWAISTLERLLNTKFVILSSEEYENGNKDGVLQCGQLNDSILQEKGEFKPDYYIVMEFTGGHYMLVIHKDTHIFTYQTLPESIRKMIVDKCLDGKENSGPYALIPEFNEYKK